MKKNILIEFYIKLQLQNYITNRALDCNQNGLICDHLLRMCE